MSFEPIFSHPWRQLLHQRHLRVYVRSCGAGGVVAGESHEIIGGSSPVLKFAQGCLYVVTARLWGRWSDLKRDQVLLFLVLSSLVSWLRSYDVLRFASSFHA